MKVCRDAEEVRDNSKMLVDILDFYSEEGHNGEEKSRSLYNRSE